MDFSFITKMISPSKGLDMLKAGIENALGEPINHFVVTYIDESEKLLITAYTLKGPVTAPFEGGQKEMIVFAVKGLAKMHLKEGETLDVVRCERMEDATINLDVCMTRNGEKIKEQITNYKP